MDELVKAEDGIEESGLVFVAGSQSAGEEIREAVK